MLNTAAGDDTVIRVILSFLQLHQGVS
jgi:hypothetical protein